MKRIAFLIIGLLLHLLLVDGPAAAQPQKDCFSSASGHFEMLAPAETWSAATNELEGDQVKRFPQTDFSKFTNPALRIPVSPHSGFSANHPGTVHPLRHQLCVLRL